jgi:8-oxo-dGTP pyrophosphatase MutT (NUDIX family)
VPGASSPALRLVDVCAAFAIGRSQARNGRAGGDRLDPVELPGPERRPAAVLCVLHEDAGQVQVLLTRRSQQLRSHTGEVSFPGGRLEDGEEPEMCALRETSEEIGLDPAAVRIIGTLRPLATTTTKAAVIPFVGVLDALPPLRPNPAEVERVFSVPLAELATPGVYQLELWTAPDGLEHPVHFFYLAGETVWGATARLLRELLDRVLAHPAPPTGPGPVAWSDR